MHQKTGISVFAGAKYAGLMLLTGGMVTPLNAYLTTLVTGHTVNKMTKVENGRVSVELGRVEYERSEKTVETITQASSILNIANALTINAGKDITIAGSEVNAGGDVTLNAGGNVNIISTEESSKTVSETIKGSGVVTVGAKHAATDVYYAGKALEEAVKALEKAKKDYDDYKENLRKARDDKGKGLIDEDDYRALESMEKYYLANIALLTENVVAKTANLVKASAGMGSSMSTALGFSGDIQLDIDASITKNKEESVTQKGSILLAGGNLSIKSGRTAKIEGSEVAANGDMSIEAENMEITASENTNKSSSSTRQAHINGSYSTDGSWGVNGDASFMESSSESVWYTNSHLSANNIIIKSKNDTTVRGGVVTANNTLDLNVGGNLLVESLQDKSTSGSHSLGLSAGYSSGKDGSGINVGGNFSASSSTKKWVTEQTSLTGNRVNIYAENKTTLKGAVIASTSNDLTLDTGSFEYIHIKDKDISYNFGGGANAGANYTGKPDEKNNTWSVNANYGFSQKRQTNFATIGEGTIIVRDGDTDLSGLNRDVTKAQYGTVDIGLKGGFTVDSSTVALVTDPGKQITIAIDSVETGIYDAGKTASEIYEKTENLIAYGHFAMTDSPEIQTNQRFLLSTSKDLLLERLGVDPEDDFSQFKELKLSDRLEYYGLKVVLQESFTNEELSDFNTIAERYLTGITIDPNSNPMEYDKEIFKFPLSGNYFENSASQTNPEAHKYGTLATVLTLINAMEKWELVGKYPMLINDLDLLNGAPSALHNNVPHRGVDINLSGKDGNLVRSCQDPNYDRVATQQQIGILLDSAPYNYEVSRILFNDPRIQSNYGKQVIQTCPGHHNHYHLEVRPTK